MVKVDSLTERVNGGEFGRKVLAEIEDIESPIERTSLYVGALTYLATNGTRGVNDLGLVKYFNEMSNLALCEISDSLMDKFKEDYSKLG